jgi:hypothetical protein
MKKLLLATVLAIASLPGYAAGQVVAIDPATIPAFGSKEHLEVHQKMRSEARALCAEAIEKKAGYGLRWTGLLNLSAPYFNGGYFFNGHYELRGDNAEAQNAFGNWVPVWFTCEWDTENKRVVDVTLERGKQPH